MLESLLEIASFHIRSRHVRPNCRAWGNPQFQPSKRQPLPKQKKQKHEHCLQKRSLRFSLKTVCHVQPSAYLVVLVVVQSSAKEGSQKEVNKQVKEHRQATGNTQVLQVLSPGLVESIFPPSNKHFRIFVFFSPGFFYSLFYSHTNNTSRIFPIFFCCDFDFFNSPPKKIKKAIERYCVINCL